MRTSCIFVLLFVLAVWALMPVTVEAAEWTKQGEEMFYFEGGAFFPAFDTKLRVDTANNGEGSDIDLENDLNFNDRETTYRLGGYWRFLSRHRIAVSYFNFKRDASATLDKEITIGDEVYPVGASLESEFKFQVIPITYMYSFMKRDKFEFELKMDLIGEMIRETRKGMNLTQEQLGKLVGVQKAQISKIENNAKDVRFSTIMKVFEALKAKVKFTIEFDRDSELSVV